MKDIVTAKDLEVMKLRAKGGTPEQRAAYVKAKKQFDTLKKQLFNEDVPYARHPDKSYVKQLKKEAEKDTSDEIDKMRYHIIASNRADLDARLEGNDGKSFRKMKHEVEEVVRSDDKNVTKGLVEKAKLVAKLNPSAENLAFYSLLKRRSQEQE